LFGDKDLGRMLEDNGRLAGPEFGSMQFYWKPPGAGYGFLGSPREVDMARPAHVVLTRSSFAEQFKGAIIADLMGAPGRRLIVATGPRTIGTPEMPYLLRRDTGHGASLFAKVLRLADDPKADPIRSVKVVTVTARDPGQPAPVQGAWCVTWTDGRRDLWIFGDGAPCRVEAEGLPAVEVEARVALARFDAQGVLLAVETSAAACLAVRGGPELKDPAAIEGRVKKVRLGGSPMRLEVSWGKGADALKNVATGALLITATAKGQPVTWRVASAGQDEVILADVKAILATCEFTRVDGKPGWYQMRPGVSRFFSAGGGPLKDYAVGRAVSRGENIVGRIAELADDGRSVQLALNNAPVDAGERFEGTIMETSADDRVTLPVEMHWRVEGPRPSGPIPPSSHHSGIHFGNSFEPLVAMDALHREARNSLAQHTRCKAVELQP